MWKAIKDWPSLTELFFGKGKGPADEKPKRARVKGKYKADDKSTPDVNEAWEGGKAPVKTKAKTKAKKAPAIRGTRKDYALDKKLKETKKTAAKKPAKKTTKKK